MSSVASMLPAIWSPLLHEKIQQLPFGPLPDIDCDDCRMVDLGMYEPHIKCCNFVPPLPNFLAGGILEAGQADNSPQRVSDWIDAGRGSPLFVEVPPDLIALHRAQQLPCPVMAADGRCTIYAHRTYLCMAFHCTYPKPEMRTFWHALTSLLALHTAIVAQYLVGLRFDTERYTRAWEEAGPEQACWNNHSLRAELYQQLWQGENDPRAFYRWCASYLREYAGIRDEIDTFRRQQLLRHLEGRLTEERRRSIEEQSTQPEPLRPPDGLTAVLKERVIVFAEHLWTVPEHESYLLWYHARAFA